MKFTLLVSVLALFLGSVVQATPAPEPQLGGVLDSLTGGLLGGSSGGGSGGGSPKDFNDETTR